MTILAAYLAFASLYALVVYRMLEWLKEQDKPVPPPNVEPDVFSELTEDDMRAMRDAYRK